MMGQHDEFVPLQPAEPPAAQCTTVTIPDEPPKDHILWSILCFAYANPCCLGLAALIFSIKSRDRKVLGDFSGAQHYGATARCINIISTIFICTIILIAVIVGIVLAVKVSQMTHQIQDQIKHSYRNPSWGG